MTGVLAALTEAWGELRVHRVRVVLALVGVFLAVFAMTTITAVGNMARQMILEEGERTGGRPASLQVSMYSMSGQPDARAAVRMEEAARQTVDRYDIRWAGLVGQQRQLVARLPQGAQHLSVWTVDPSYGTMHRLVPDAGRWFTEADADLLSPAVVVNEVMAATLGGFDPVSPPTVVLSGGTGPLTATVVGVADVPWTGPEQPAAYVLNAAAPRLFSPEVLAQQTPTLEVWVPDADAEELQGLLVRDLKAALPGYQVDAYRQDSAEEAKILGYILDYGVRGVGIFALVLGGLGVLNVGLVTVRQRIREIGVRRSFGATSGRVFTAVLLESVCATALTGALAVALSVALVENLPIDLLTQGQLSLTDVPSFPFSAALEGFLAATAIGALAGVVPAVVAVRAKVIDAIRY
ncbi:ABC transporter permease [Kineococcus sp. NUM-3379]